MEKQDSCDSCLEPEELSVSVRGLTSIVLDKPHGILKEGFEPQYKEIYSEQFSGNWCEHLVKSNAVHTKMKNLCIVYPLSVAKTEPTRTKAAPDQEILKNGHSSDISTGSPTSSAGEPCIISEYVDVFISCVASTTKVYFRFIEYEEAYTKLLQEMTAFFTSGPSSTKIADSPEVAKLYATCYNGRCLRVEPLRNAEKGKVECCFVDEGNSLPICVENLWELPEHFVELAHQAVECELDRLAECADCDGAVDIRLHYYFSQACLRCAIIDLLISYAARSQHDFACVIFRRTFSTLQYVIYTVNV
uniref:Tudor domain-containing protein n=1 Tax=Rhipicephalus microplus TaxID=6941 RepID=A0A6M2D704_RHIMP